MNKYDIVGTFKCPRNIMDTIDKGIIKQYTAIDYREFTQFINSLNNNKKEN